MSTHHHILHANTIRTLARSGHALKPACATLGLSYTTTQHHLREEPAFRATLTQGAAP